MNRTEALALARAKWGDDARTRQYRRSCVVGYAKPDNGTLGHYITNPMQSVGKGNDWESACRAAGLIPDSTEGR